MQSVFEYYRRKPEFLTAGTSFEGMYVPAGEPPSEFVAEQWDYVGKVLPPKSATVAEVRNKLPIYRSCPSWIDPKVFWPNL